MGDVFFKRVGINENVVEEGNTELVEEFTKRYGVHRLVYYELHEDMVSAIRREKQVKKWNRAWKLELIESQNSGWRDLWEEIV